MNKSICLTLPEQPERTDRARQHFDDIGLNVHFLTAINGHKTGLVSTHPWEHDHPGSGYVIGPATIGIYLSHLMAWSVAQVLEQDYTLILEDDAALVGDFKARMNQALLYAPEDWDMLFLGSCCTDGHDKRLIAGAVYEMKWPQCLHCYIIHQRAIPTLLQNCQDVYGPIDCVLRLNGFFGLKVYTVLPRIAEQLNTNLPV